MVAKLFEVKLPTVGVEAPTAEAAYIMALNLCVTGEAKATVRPMNRTTLSKKKGQGPASPLTWWPMGRGAQIMCSEGHAIVLLAEIHEIRDNGEITPSVVCGGSCRFHAFIRLEDWRT